MQYEPAVIYQPVRGSSTRSATPPAPAPTYRLPSARQERKAAERDLARQEHEHLKNTRALGNDAAYTGRAIDYVAVLDMKRQYTACSPEGNQLALQLLHTFGQRAAGRLNGM